VEFNRLEGVMPILGKFRGYTNKGAISVPGITSILDFEIDVRRWKFLRLEIAKWRKF
jgi:hypothetical protein